MDDDLNISAFNIAKEKAKKHFEDKKKIYCPYFGVDVILNSDGFHHLQFSARRERNKSEQLLKFNLLPLALEIIRKSGTVQEIREEMLPLGHKSKDGLTVMKKVKYWAFVAIVGERKIKVRAILRQVGDGNIIFWSVMPDSKLSGQKLYSKGIGDD